MNMSAQRAKMKGAYLFVSIRRGVEADVNDPLVANRDFTDLRTEQAECLMQAHPVCIYIAIHLMGSTARSMLRSLR